MITISKIELHVALWRCVWLRVFSHAEPHVTGQITSTEVLTLLLAVAFGVPWVVNTVDRKTTVAMNKL
jgi:hypothetical protein